MIDMQYDTYRLIFISAFFAGGGFLLITVFLFFWDNIPKVIGDLTGRTARKAIKSLTEQNSVSGDKAYKPSYVNMERGKITDKISNSGNVAQSSPSPLGTYAGTTKIDTMEFYDDTTFLGVPQETTLLRETQDVSPLQNPFAARNISYANQTTLLNDNKPIPVETKVAGGFYLEEDVTFTHTNETIS